MATITTGNIAEAIRNFICAGKRLPREETLKTAKNADEAAKKIFDDTVEIFARIFLPQKIGVDRWRAAEQIAATMTECGALNVNIATPALMQAALKQAEQNHVDAQIAENDRAKLDPLISEGLQENSLYLLPWTYGHLGRKRDIAPYKPTQEQFAAFCLKHQISIAVQNKRGVLIKAYLNDCNYAQKHGTQPESKLFIDRENEEIRMEFCGGLAQQIEYMRRTRTA